MKLLTDVKIENFRSCRTVTLAGIGSFSVLTGLNNTGKSNILRALSLFFTGEVEPGVQLDLARDYGGPRWKKRLIRVSARLRFPTFFGKNKRQQQLMARIGEWCLISREWTLDDLQGQAKIESSANGGHGDRDAAAILDLVKFRFIPAHRDPAVLLGQEEPGISAEIVRLFKIYQQAHSRRASAPNLLSDADTDAAGSSAQKQSASEAQLQDLRTVASQYLGEVAEELAHQVQSVKSVEITTPEEFADFIKIQGYLVTQANDKRLAEVLQGSGVQSSLMFQMLARADTSFSKYFGTKQGVIWLIEEPECFLHTMLECDTARFFSEATHNDKRRLQIIASTHSDTMMQYADQGFVTRTDEDSCTTAEAMAGLELVDNAVVAGIARLDHVLLWRRNQPLVLVEGKTDRRYLEKAADLARIELPFVLWDLAALTRSERGGHDALKAFLKGSSQVLAARPLSAPLVYLADWDVRGGDIESLSSDLSRHHKTSMAMRTDRSAGNPNLHVGSGGSVFKGMEAFLSTRIIEEGQATGILSLARADRTGKIQPTEPLDGQAKKRLCDLFCETAQLDDCVYLLNVLDQLRNATRLGASSQPRMDFEGD